MRMKLILSAVFVVLLSLGFSETSSAQSCYPRGGYGGGYRSYGYGGPRVVIAVRPPMPVYRSYGYARRAPRRYYPRPVYRGNCAPRSGYGRSYDTYSDRGYDNNGGNYNNRSYDDVYDNY
jgi:hypothetical protein